MSEQGDRALDLWLAEHVMGYQRIDSGVFVSWVLAADHSTRAPFGEHSGYPTDDDVPRYTGRDWPLLATALTKLNWHVQMDFFPSGHVHATIGWYGNVAGRPNDAPWTGFAKADTPGLALGRAAEQALKDGEE